MSRALSRSISAKRRDLLAPGRPRRGGAVRVDDLAPAAELAPPLLPDPVRGQQVDAVLGRAGERDQLGLHLAATGKLVGWATGRRPRARASRHLGEAEVVADLDADPAERRVPDVELVAGGDEAVDAEERQVGLPVGADQAVGSDEHGRVAEPVAVALEQAADGVHAEPRALRSSASTDGPEPPRRTAAPPRALSNM